MGSFSLGSVLYLCWYCELVGQKNSKIMLTWYMNGPLQIFLILIYFIFLQSETLKHGSSRKCLAISDKKDRLLMESCQPKEPRQRWKFSTYNPSNASSPWEQIKKPPKVCKKCQNPRTKTKKGRNRERNFLT